MKRKTKYILIFFGLALLYYIVNYKINSGIETSEKYFQEHYKLGWTDFDVDGIIVDKFIDSINHNYPVVVIRGSNDQNFKFFFQTHDLEFYNYTQIGDSIQSESRSFKATIFRVTGVKKFSFLKNN